MSLLATPREMKRIDEETISSGYSSAIELMERAGRSVATEAEELTEKGDRVSVFCGKGNNGGDGFVAARYLIKKQRKVHVYLLGRKDEIKGESCENLKRFIRQKGKVTEIKDSADFERLKECHSSRLFIDALLGIGIRGEAKGIISQGIDFINRLKKEVIAVDVPSGLDARDGIVKGPCVRASVTVTFGLGKPGLFLAPGINFSGKVKVVDIGLRPESIRKMNLSHFLLDRDEMCSLIPRRNLDCHKGECGHVLVIAGSPGLTGAACLASSGAVRSGAGLVTLAIPESLNIIVASKLTEVMTRPLPETDEKTISIEAFSIIKNFSLKCRSVAIGPGLSRNMETCNLVLKIIENISIPMVIDADALFALSREPHILKKAKAPLILTPHLGEMARLLNKEIPYVRKNKLDIARIFSRDYNVIVVLKGAGTIIASPEGNIYINPTGNPSLSSGGTGDVLTGIIASLLAQGLRPVDAARLGVYLHGMAADEIALSRGPWGVVASDILMQVPLSMYNLSLSSSQDSVD